MIYGPWGDLAANTYKGYHYHCDGLGSTAFLSGGAGTLLESYTYDPNGTPTLHTVSGGPYNTQFLFTGQQWYPTLGFYDLRNRAYLPSIGRFLQPDPIGFAGDPANLYRYCGNNPANLSDSSGLVAGWDDAALFVGGGIVGVIGQGVHDLVAGSAPTWQSYTAAFIGGGIGGVALEYGGPVAAGGLGAITTDMVRQELNLMTGQQQTYDPMQTLVNTGVGMALGTVPGPHSDRNSNQALAKQILTKVENGTIKRITPKTGFKVAHGLLKGSNALSGTITGTLFATALPYNGIGGENQTDGDIPEIPVTETVDSNGNIVQQTIDDPKNAISTDH